MLFASMGMELIIVIGIMCLAFIVYWFMEDTFIHESKDEDDSTDDSPDL